MPYVAALNERQATGTEGAWQPALAGLYIYYH